MSGAEGSEKESEVPVTPLPEAPKTPLSEGPLAGEPAPGADLFSKIRMKVLQLVTRKTSAPTTARNPTSENIAPVTTDRSIKISESGDDPVLLRFLNIMSKVNTEMYKAGRRWASNDEDARTDPRRLRELQEFGLLATKDAQYQREIHQLIKDRFGSGPITVYHSILMGGSVLEGKTGFMPGTTSLKTAEFYARAGRIHGNRIIETLVIQPDDIIGIGAISGFSEVIFIPRQPTSAL